MIYMKHLKKLNSLIPQAPVSSPEEISSDPNKVQITRDMANAIFRKVMDGYSNAIAHLGEQSPQVSSGTFVRSNLTDRLETLTVAYRENWLVKRIIDMPCEDMTRGWYKLSSASLDAEALEDLYRLEARHSIKQEIINAIRWCRLYGGSLALMVVREPWHGEPDLSRPLIPKELLPGSFKGVLVLDRTNGIEPSLELVDDLEDPDYGQPEYYTVQLSFNGSGPKPVKIHHSRVMKFTGRELPQQEMERENYWGASEMEHIWDEVMKRSAASANIIQLMFQANITTLKMGHLGEDLALGSERTKQNVLQAIENENRLRNSYGLQILSSTDSYENHPYSFNGINDIYESFMMDMAGAAEIPAAKLFGRSPQGMNSTGEMDLRNYYDMIAQLQERHLRPALEKLLPVMAYSCWGYCPKDLKIIFEPAMVTSPTERAALAKDLSADVIEAVKCGIITPEEARAEMKSRGEKLGVWGQL